MTTDAQRSAASQVRKIKQPDLPRSAQRDLPLSCVVLGKGLRGLGKLCSVSNPLKHPAHGLLLIGGAVVALVGVVGLAPRHAALGLVVWAVGMAILFLGAWLHDRMHLGQGEAPHALWGTNDRHRPRWLKRRPGD